MQMSELRIALFSGNYNMTLDGANKALNRLVEYLLRQGAAVRVYSPTVSLPAFAPQGDLVSVPSFAIPGRSEYRMPVGISASTRADLEKFAPNLLHIASPDFSARAAVRWAKSHGLPVLASVHTRFETYPRYYNLGFLEAPLEAWIRGLYRRCDALVTPSESMVEVLREQDMNDDISIWSRGVDRTMFDPTRSCMAARTRDCRRGRVDRISGPVGNGKGPRHFRGHRGRTAKTQSAAQGAGDR
jgi:glycosyltransferase involved in cell wall biosynthesis